MGPWVCGGLKKTYGENEVLCQGVSKNGMFSASGYSASLTDNVGGIQTSRSAVAEATKMFQKAVEKCPNAVITFGGYSQGTAVMVSFFRLLEMTLTDHLFTARNRWQASYGYPKQDCWWCFIRRYPQCPRPWPSSRFP